MQSSDSVRHVIAILLPCLLCVMSATPVVHAQCEGDLNRDGVVNGVDLSIVLAQWGNCPTPSVPAWATVIEQEPDPAVVTSESLRQSIIATGLPWRVRDTYTQIEMVLIPPGTFQMGCSGSIASQGCDPSEYPVHAVTLTKAFYLGRFEVTQAQWTARIGFNPSQFVQASAQVLTVDVSKRPVENVSWNFVQVFLSETEMRLPTEAEWEFVYRAGTTRAFHGHEGYPNGTNDDNQLSSIAWWAGNSLNQTRPVGSKLGNGFGVHDMAGNVWEWVSDAWDQNYYGQSPSSNPTGPAPVTGSQRVYRGGGAFDHSAYCRASNRAPGSISFSSGNLGFRVARNP